MIHLHRTYAYLSNKKTIESWQYSISVYPRTVRSSIIKSPLSDYSNHSSTTQSGSVMKILVLSQEKCFRMLKHP